jgi:hypothetical protein
MRERHGDIIGMTELILNQSLYLVLSFNRIISPGFIDNELWIPEPRTSPLVSEYCCNLQRVLVQDARLGK